MDLRFASLSEQETSIPSDVAFQASISHATSMAKRSSNCLTRKISSLISSTIRNNTSCSRTRGNCLVKRLQNSTFSSSVFEAQEYGSFTFANCSLDLSVFGIERVDCLSDENHTVIIDPAGARSLTWFYPLIGCRTWTVSVPVAQQYRTNITESAFLKWDAPDCRSCEKSGGRCRFKGSTGSDVGCFSKPGLSKRAKLGILLGILLPMLLCMSGLAFYLSSRARVSGHRDPRDRPPEGNDIEDNVANITSPSIPSRETRHASDDVAGIDLITIESYPKIQVGDDGRVPRPNENVCAICLSKYQPKETIQTIPNCGHCFHAQCIDQWLKWNASCPLCRNHKGSSDSMTASN